MYTRQQLQDIYGIGTSAMKDRIIKLGIFACGKGEKNIAYYSEEDKQKLDQLHEYLKEKGSSIATFIPASKTEVVEEKTLAVSNENSISSERKFLLSVPSISIAERLKDIITQSDDPFIRLELLQQLADRKRFVPTKELAVIIGVSASTLRKYKSYSYWGFMLSQQIQGNGTLVKDHLKQEAELAKNKEEGVEEQKQHIRQVGRIVYWEIAANNH